MSFSTPRAQTINELIRLDTVFLGGAAFVLSFVVKGGRLLRPLLLGMAVTVPGCLVIDLTYVGRPPYWLLCILIVIAQGASILVNVYLPVRWRRVRMLGVGLCVVFCIATLFVAKDRESIYGWIMCEIFLYAGLLYSGTYRRLSVEYVSGTIGFLAWSLWYLLADHLQTHPRELALLWQFWNLPKYIVSFAMTLRIFEHDRADIVKLADKFKLLYEDFHILYENHPLPMWIYDRDSLKFLSVNKAACVGYGYSTEEFLEKAVTEIVSEGTTQACNDRANGARSLLQHGRHRLRDGTEISVELTEREILFRNKAAGFVLAVDVTEREELNRKLVYRAQHDVLTGLPNRQVLEDHLVQSLERASQNRAYAALFTVDVDRFKLINDTHGHVVGDECLQEIASRLRGFVRGTDTIARTGGEEFTIVAGEVRDVEEMEALAERLVGIFERPLRLSSQELKVSISVGAALYPDDAADAETLRKRSDQALFYAKRNGRGRYALASAEVSASFNENLAVERAVREALRNDGFELVYQPIYDREGCARRFEALLRMKPTSAKVFSPATFIPVAEESGLILSLGSWVIRQVCAQLKQWRNFDEEGLRVAINVSARQLAQKGFAASVLETLREYELPPECIELELTETALMSEPELIRTCMETLAGCGVQFAIDDFGTGYSSLARLADLPISTLKIDRSFVTQLNQTIRGEGLVVAILQMAETMGVRVVAEGVDDETQLKFLLDRGCDFFQGFYLSKPMPVDLLSITLRERSRLLLCHTNFGGKGASRPTPVLVSHRTA